MNGIKKMLEIHTHICPEGIYKVFKYPITVSGKIAYAKVGVYEVMLAFCPNCGQKLMKTS